MSEEFNLVPSEYFMRHLQFFLQASTNSDSVNLNQDLVNELYFLYVNRSDSNETPEDFMIQILNSDPSLSCHLNDLHALGENDMLALLIRLHNDTVESPLFDHLSDLHILDKNAMKDHSLSDEATGTPLFDHLNDLDVLDEPSCDDGCNLL